MIVSECGRNLPKIKLQWISEIVTNFQREIYLSWTVIPINNKPWKEAMNCVKTCQSWLSFNRLCCKFFKAFTAKYYINARLELCFLSVKITNLS